MKWQNKRKGTLSWSTRKNVLLCYSTKQKIFKLS